ncbi:PAS domain-containing sensor histidine kinase [Azospirillum sp. sgz302134]
MAERSNQWGGQQGGPSSSAAPFLLERLPLPLYVADRDGRLHLTNDAFRRMVGLAPDALEARRLTDVLPADLLSKGAGTLTDAEGHVRDVLLHQGGSDGQEADGWTIGSLVDVSQLKAVQRDLLYQNTVIKTQQQAAPDGILVIDEKGAVVSYNDRFVTMWRIPQAAIDSRDDGQLRASVIGLLSDPEGFLARVNYLYANPLVDDRDEVALVDGRTFERHSTALVAPDGTNFGRIWFFRDITERKKAESELRAAKEEAETALGRLRDAQQTLIRTEKMAALGSLVAGVAHEINTPVGNATTGASQLGKEIAELERLFQEKKLRAQDLQKFLRDAGEACNLILSNCQRAAHLVQSFKQVAVDQTGGERRVFDLREYLDEILLSLRPRLKHTPHTVAVECPPDILVDGDPGAFSQIITNLVMNALLHAFDDGRAGHILIRGRQLPDDRIEIVFRDDGKGIPKDIQDKVFDPFFTTKRGGGGSGLGLHILFNLVTGSLGGNVELESVPGEGTAFHIVFPRVLKAAARKA